MCGLARSGGAPGSKCDSRASPTGGRLDMISSPIFLAITVRAHQGFTAAVVTQYKNPSRVLDGVSIRNFLIKGVW